MQSSFGKPVGARQAFIAPDAWPTGLEQLLAGKPGAEVKPYCSCLLPLFGQKTHHTVCLGMH